jgi:hypothetical protein
MPRCPGPPTANCEHPFPAAPRSGQLLLNPRDKEQLKAGDKLVFVARSPKDAKPTAQPYEVRAPPGCMVC